MIIDVQNEIFSNIEVTKNFLLEQGVIQRIILCTKCGANASLNIDGKYEGHLIQWRCSLSSCRKRIRLTSSKLPIGKLLHCIYLLMADTNYQNMFIFHGISDATIRSIKEKLISIYSEYIVSRPTYLGGLGVIVEIDETVLSRRGVVRYPTSTDDSRTDTVWILGMVEKYDTKKFVIKKIDNRQINTLIEALDGVVLIGSNLYSDGYPSYPNVAQNLYLNHCVVNHSNGFVAQDGTHTNSIEGFWSHLKTTMRKEHGVMRDNIDEWLIQYTFRRRYVMGCSREEFSEKFVEILKIWFT